MGHLLNPVAGSATSPSLSPVLSSSGPSQSDVSSQGLRHEDQGGGSFTQLIVLHIARDRWLGLVLEPRNASDGLRGGPRDAEGVHIEVHRLQVMVLRQVAAKSGLGLGLGLGTREERRGEGTGSGLGVTQ